MCRRLCLLAVVEGAAVRVARSRGESASQEIRMSFTWTNQSSEWLYQVGSGATGKKTLTI